LEPWEPCRNQPRRLRSWSVKHATPDGLAENVRETLTKLGHAPEDSFGLAPNFQSRKIFFGLRKG
jgi:hypothetical protein